MKWADVRKGHIMAKHLTIEERFWLLEGIEKKKSISKIAKLLNRSITTLTNELKDRSQIERKGSPFRKFNDCLHREHCFRKEHCNLTDRCTKKRCNHCTVCHSHCERYEKEYCCALSLPPYVCNGCSKRVRCSLEKRLYYPIKAQQEYERLRSESREGISYSHVELKRINDLISPLVQQGQSLYHIHLHLKDQLMISLQTLYNLVHNKALDLRLIDLPKAVKYRPRKAQKPLKIDKQCHKERTYQDFLNYTQQFPHLEIIEMDSVEGPKGGKVLLTFYFRNSGFLLAYLREANTAGSVVEIFNRLKTELTLEGFLNLFPILLTDRGSEFTHPTAIEAQQTLTTGEKIQTKLFYCDPRRPQQKASVENVHRLIRNIIPKGASMNHLTQDDIQKMVDHINSYSRKNLNGRSPFQLFKFLHSSEILQKLNCSEVDPSQINLTPSLLTK